MNVKSKYAVVGFGLAGALMSWKLHLAGHKVDIFSDRKPSASRVAAGLINPITGRSYVKTWMYDELQKSFVDCYSKLETKLNRSFLNSLPIIRQLMTIAEENKWYSRLNQDEYLPYIMDKDEVQKWSYGLPQENEYAGISGGYQLKINELLDALTDYFEESFLGKFNYSELDLSQMLYRDEAYSGVIFCEGWQMINNPLFSNIPLVPNKGEVLTLPQSFPKWEIGFKSRQFFLPFADDLLWWGGTYEKGQTSLEPSQSKHEELMDAFTKTWGYRPEKVNQIAGIRPTSPDRKPIIGCHRHFPNIYLFNGMGTKGSSLAPYYADMLIELVLRNKPVHSDVDIRRYDRK